MDDNEDYPLARALSWCCPFQTCKDTDAGRKGWVDPIHAQQHISIRHRKYGRRRKPVSRRWPHPLVTYNSTDAWLFDVGPMTEGPLETQ